MKIPNRISIRELRSKHLSRFVAIEGMIRKATEVRPRIMKAAFQCLRCGHLTVVEQNSFKFEEPFSGCENDTCGKKGPFKVMIGDSTFIDAQKLQIQESPENLKGGSQPQSLEIDSDDELTGNVTPGDRVIINGILKSVQRTLKDGKSTFYDLVLQANSIEHLDKIKVESPIMTLKGPFFPHVSFSQPEKGSSNLKLFCSTTVRCPHLRHWKAAFMILGLTSVAFLIIPSIATKRERCLLLNSLMDILFGIFIILT